MIVTVQAATMLLGIYGCVMYQVSVFNATNEIDAKLRILCKNYHGNNHLIDSSTLCQLFIDDLNLIGVNCNGNSDFESGRNLSYCIVIIVKKISS